MNAILKQSILSLALVAIILSTPARSQVQVGGDFSANAPSIPVSGFSLLTTIPATRGRSSVEVQNQSAGTIQVVLDDGAGNSPSSVILTGTGAGAQGGGWSSDTFKGRVLVYGSTGAQVMARQY